MTLKEKFKSVETEEEFVQFLLDMSLTLGEVDGELRKAVTEKCDSLGLKRSVLKIHYDLPKTK